MSTHEELPIGPMWPEVPWPKDVWPTTIEEAGKLLRAKLGDNDTTAISGTLMRHGWKCAEQAFKTLLEEHGFSAPNKRRDKGHHQKSVWSKS